MELDHIVRVVDRPDLAWDQENWQGLCVPCHRKKTAEENRGEIPASEVALHEWVAAFDE